jgi:hypothetical protein
MAALEDLKVKTAELLDEGLRTGALTTEEHSWRSGHLANADSVEALEVLVEDLLSPRSATSALTVARASQLNLMSNRTFAVADLGRRSELVTVMGSTKLDLRALAPGEALTLELVTIMGDTTVEVPAGVKVRVDCTPVMGDTHIDPSLRSPEAPVRITGVVVMGSLRIVPLRVPG